MLGSKNFCQQAQIAEQWFSQQSQKGIALLLSTKVARKYHIKQIDYALIEQNQGFLWEIKSCKFSTDLALERAISNKEKLKWFRTKAFLSNILGMKLEVNIAVINLSKGIDFVKKHILV